MEKGVKGMNGVKKLIGLGLLVGFFNVCAYASFDQREDVLQWLDEADSSVGRRPAGRVIWGQL